jgi:hypothetical protein
MSKIDVSKLTNVVKKDGKTVARCPACAARGGDAKGIHLVIYDDGKFGCVAAGDKGHNRTILQLVGVQETAQNIYRVPVRRVEYAPPKTIKTVGRFGRGSSTAPAVEGLCEDQTQDIVDKAPNEPKSRPTCPAEPLAQTAAVEPPAAPISSSRPKVPLKVQQELKRLIWRPEGGFDPDILDQNGEPTLVMPKIGF